MNGTDCTRRLQIRRPSRGKKYFFIEFQAKPRTSSTANLSFFTTAAGKIVGGTAEGASNITADCFANSGSPGCVFGCVFDCVSKSAAGSCVCSCTLMFDCSARLAAAGESMPSATPKTYPSTELSFNFSSLGFDLLSDSSVKSSSHQTSDTIQLLASLAFFGLECWTRHGAGRQNF